MPASNVKFFRQIVVLQAHLGSIPFCNVSQLVVQYCYLHTGYMFTYRHMGVQHMICICLQHPGAPVAGYLCILEYIDIICYMGVWAYTPDSELLCSEIDI